MVFGINNLLEKLKSVKRSGNGYSARCPAHSDGKNSLSISEKDNRILLRCFAGCSTEKICFALGIELKDLFLNSQPDNKKRVVETYDYRDENGNLLYQNVRFDPKDFRQCRFDDNDHAIWDLNGVRRVPYQLPELIAALRENPDFNIVLTEGEKDADNLRIVGFVASSFKNWRKEFNQYIEGANVTLLIDHDQAGIKQANSAAQIIADATKSIKIVDLFENELLPEKHGKDVSDWLTDGRDPTILQKIIDNAPLWTKPSSIPQLSEKRSTSEINAKESNIIPLRTVKISDVEAREVKWLWKPFIPMGTFVIIEGAEGEGKTFVCLALACAIASGKGLPLTPEDEYIEPSNVLLISAEDSLPYTIKPRLKAMNAAAERIIAIEDSFTLDRNGFAHLEMILAENEPKLVIIDPLFSYVGKINLNNDNEIRTVTDNLKRLAEKYDCAIIGIRHIGKSKGMGDPRSAVLNGVGWRASARSVLLVGKNPDNEKEKAICQTKSNLAPLSKKAIGFEIRDDQFFWTGESSLTAQKILSLPKSEDERAAQSEVIAFLRDALGNSEREASEIQREAEKAGGVSVKLCKSKISIN